MKDYQYNIEWLQKLGYLNDTDKEFLTNCYSGLYQYAELIEVQEKDLIRLLTCFLDENEGVYINEFDKEIIIIGKDNGIELEGLELLFQLVGCHVDEIIIHDKLIKIKYHFYCWK